MRTIKVLAIIGLVVALVAMPALAQPRTLTITVKCVQGGTPQQPTFTLQADPARLEGPNAARIGDTIQWVFDASLRTCGPLMAPPQAGAQPVFNVSEIKITFAPTSPFADTTISIPQSQFAASGNVATVSRTVNNVGTHKYKIEFLRQTGTPPQPQPIPNTTINGTNTVIQATPTLTEWGLIALAVLLAGSLAWMIRRRVIARPAGAA